MASMALQPCIHLLVHRYVTLGNLCLRRGQRLQERNIRVGMTAVCGRPQRTRSGTRCRVQQFAARELLDLTRPTLDTYEKAGRNLET